MGNYSPFRQISILPGLQYLPPRLETPVRFGHLSPNESFRAAYAKQSDPVIDHMASLLKSALSFEPDIYPGRAGVLTSQVSDCVLGEGTHVFKVACVIFKISAWLFRHLCASSTWSLHDLLCGCAAWFCWCCPLHYWILECLFPTASTLCHGQETLKLLNLKSLSLIVSRVILGHCKCIFFITKQHNHILFASFQSFSPLSRDHHISAHTCVSLD